MKRFSIICTATLCLGFHQASTAENIYQIYRDAVASDPVMKAAQAKLRADLETKNIALGTLLPQIGVEGNITSTETNSEGVRKISGGDIYQESGSNTTGWKAVISQQLFDAKKWYAFRSGQAISAKAEAEFIKNEQDLIFRTAEAYLNVLRAHTNLESSIAEETAVKQQLDQTQQRFDVGLVAITDVHESRAAYDLSKVTRLINEGALETAYEGLTILTGQSYSSISPISDKLPIGLPTPADRNSWVELALQNNLDILASRHAVKAAQANAKASSSDHLPVIKVEAFYSEDSGDYTEKTIGLPDKSLDDAFVDTTGVALTASLPLFRGGSVSAKRRQAYAQSDQARETLAGLERSISQQMRAYHIAVLTGIQQVAARKQAITSAESAVESIQAGYNYGTRTIVDLLNAQRTLFSAQRDYANARFDYILNLYQLKQAAGALTANDIQSLNQWSVISAELSKEEALTAADKIENKDS